MSWGLEPIFLIYGFVFLVRGLGGGYLFPFWSVVKKIILKLINKLIFYLIQCY